MKKKILLGLLFLGVTTTSFAGVIKVTTSCGKTTEISSSGKTMQEVIDEVEALDAKMCNTGSKVSINSDLDII